MSDLVVKYLTDSIEGNSLSTIVRGEGRGWVEYCNRAGQLYHADGVEDKFFQQLKNEVIADISNWWKLENRKQLGFVHHLATVLTMDRFVFPMLGTVGPDSDYPEITVGRSRLAASILNGLTADDFKSVVFAIKDRTVKNLKNISPLNSTIEFDKMYHLKDIDYEIAMSDNVSGNMNDLKFIHSILKHSIYDKIDQALPHTDMGSKVMGFWQQHVRKDKILVNVRCTAEVEKLIQPSNIFTYNVTHENPEDWVWSYGKILGSYRKTEGPKNYENTLLNLWLYNATEPIHLELMIPWMSGQYTCCYTQNKKALIFDTSIDATSMQPIGDWVK